MTPFFFFAEREEFVIFFPKTFRSLVEGIRGVMNIVAVNRQGHPISKPWTRLFCVSHCIITFGKVWIKLSSLQL